MSIETIKNKALLLEKLPEARTMTELAKTTGVHRATIYYYLANDDEFKRVWGDILAHMVEAAINTAKVSSEQVMNTLSLVALDPDHKEWLGAVKEFNRVLEKRTSDRPMGELELKVNLMGEE